MKLLFLQNSSYGTYHIIWLVACILLIVGLSIFNKKINLNIWFKILLVEGVISETIKCITYISNNIVKYGNEPYLSKTDLPFHLCSIQLVFIVILNLSKNEKLKKLLMSFMLPTCLIGGLAAILIPTYSSLNMPLISVQYFIYHAIISAFAVKLLLQKEFEFNMKDYRNSLILLYVMFMIALYLNGIVATPDMVNGTAEHYVNFMYVVYSADESLPFLNSSHGWLVYIAHYVCLAIFCVSLVYIKVIINGFKNLKNKKNNKSETIENPVAE